MWKQQANAIGAAALASQLGLSTCPACESVTSSPRRDRLGSVKLRDDGTWHCFACDTGGDGVALLAAYAVGTTRPATAQGWADTEAVAARLGMTTGPMRPAAERARVVLPERGTARYYAARTLAYRMARAYAEHADTSWKREMAWCYDYTVRNAPEQIDRLLAEESGE